MVYKVWISRNEETLMANALGRVCKGDKYKEIREEIILDQKYVTLAMV